MSSPLWSLPGFSWAGLTTLSIAASVFLVASVFSMFCVTVSCYTENVLSTAISIPSTVDCELLKDRDHEAECPVNLMWRIKFDSWFRIFVCFFLFVYSECPGSLTFFRCFYKVVFQVLCREDVLNTLTCSLIFGSGCSETFLLEQPQMFGQHFHVSVFLFFLFFVHSALFPIFAGGFQFAAYLSFTANAGLFCTLLAQRSLHLLYTFLQIWHLDIVSRWLFERRQC